MPEKERIRPMGQRESVRPEKRKDRNTTKQQGKEEAE